MTEEDDDLVAVFVPALVVVLAEHERRLGRPLGQDEVLELRDRSVVVVMRGQDALAMDARRGYPDLDPEDVWVQWQAWRAGSPRIGEP